MNEEFRRNYHHGTLVLWPPDDVQAVVGALREHYDPASQAICDAHITLTQPFLAQPTARELNMISEIVASHLPQQIEYGPIGSFLPYPCVYLEVKPSNALRTMQRELYELNLFNLNLPFSDPDDYVFHMSITDGYPDAQQTRLIFDALQGREPSGTFQISTVAYIQPDQNFRFSVVELLG